MNKLAKKKRMPDASKSRGKEMNEKPLQPVKDQDQDQEQDSEAIERAVYDGMQDLRARKSR